VCADREIFRSAVPYAERGVVLRRRVGRALAAHEVLLFADVRQDAEDDVRANLRPGESSLTVPVPQARVAPSLRVGDEVAFLLAEGKPPADRRLLGPFRLVGFGARADPFQATALGKEEVRKVVVAVTPGPEGKLDPGARLLDEALRARPLERSERLLAVEHYRAGKK
jgi:hypothetical protein